MDRLIFYFIDDYAIFIYLVIVTNTMLALTKLTFIVGILHNHYL